MDRGTRVFARVVTIGDKRVWPVVQRIYTGQNCRDHQRELCQYELSKAVRRLKPCSDCVKQVRLVRRRTARLCAPLSNDFRAAAATERTTELGADRMGTLSPRFVRENCLLAPVT